jgi:hypothetical protein
MEWLALFFVIETGVVPFDYGGYYDGEAIEYRTHDDISWFTNLEIELEFFDLLICGSSVYTHYWKLDDMHIFSPDTVLYGTWVGIHYGLVGLEWRHYCSHGIVTRIYSGTVDPYHVFSFDTIILRISNK